MCIFASRKVNKVMEKIEKTTLLDTYLDYNNLTLRSARRGEPVKRDAMPFTPMFLMDVMNLIYEEYIAPLPLKHIEKRIRTRWHEAYKHFTSEFFCAFNDDQKYEICELMNDFEEHIHNEVEIFRTTVMSKFMQYDTDVRLVLSSTLACNVLAQSAEWLWDVLHSRKKSNIYIRSVVDWSQKFLYEYGDKRLDRSFKQVDLNGYKDLSLAINRLCKSIGEYSKGVLL